MVDQQTDRRGGGDTIKKGPNPLAWSIGILIVGLLVTTVGFVVSLQRKVGGDSAPELRGAVLPVALPKPDFTLTDTRGEAYDFRERTAGKLTLLFFGFTNCPDVCPVHMANVAAVLRGLPAEQRNQIEVVFVSADPARDTPERIRQWLDAFDPKFVGLRGTLDEINTLLDELRLPPVVIDEPDENGNYNVGHPAQILAFTPDDLLRVVYPFGLRQADWAHDLPKLLRYTDGEAKARRGVEATTAYVPAPAVDGPAALYVKVTNHGKKDDVIVGAVSSVAGRIELHRQVLRDGRVRMEQIHEIALPAGGTATLEPGGDHFMLMDLRRRLVPGDTFTMELSLRQGGTVPVEAVVVDYADLEGVFATEHAHHHEEG